MRDFRFTDDQRAFQAAVRDVLAKECSPDRVRAAAEAGEHDDTRWKALVDLGVVGLTVPEEHGGLGMTMLDLVLLLEEAGYAALPEPLLEVTAVTVPLLIEAGGDDAQSLLAGIARQGWRVITVVDDPQPHAGWGAGSHLAWDERGELVHARAVSVLQERGLDATRDLARVASLGENSSVLLAGEPAAAARSNARDHGALGAAAMMVGAAARMIDLAVDHARQREQFGVPIGSFQAVKHHLSNALVKVEFARPAVYRAAWSLSHGVTDAHAHTAMAKVLANEAAEFTAKAALQVHGAIGYTWEHELHLWMERAWSLASSYGTADEHRARLRAHVLG